MSGPLDGDALLAALLARMLEREKTFAAVRAAEERWGVCADLSAPSTLDVIVAWMRAHLERVGARGFVLGVSGGVDSSLGAVLAARAAPGRCMGYLMPCGSDPADEADARALLNVLEVEYRVVPLEKVVDEMLAQYGTTRTAAPPLAVGNLASRLRQNVLYLDANLSGRLVVGTGDLDEAYIGYGCKGSGSDIYPTNSLHKNEVRALLRAALAPLDGALAERLSARRASAGYWKGHDAEEEIGTSYDVIGRVVDLVMQHCPVQESGFFPEDPQAFLAALEASGVTSTQFLDLERRILANYHKSFSSPTLYRPQSALSPTSAQ